MKLALLGCIGGLALTVPAPAQSADELARQLANSDARARQQAVSALAALGSAEAWRLVLGALADPEPRVADEAELRLGELRDPAFVELVLGHDGLGSRKDLVAVRAAEALGRMELELDPEPLLRSLSAGDAELRRTLFWTIERQARGGHLSGRLEGRPFKAVEAQWRKERDELARAAALSTLFALSAEQARGPFREALEDERASVRASAAEALSQLPIEERAAAFLRLAGDPSVAVRTRIVRNLAARRDRIGVVALVDRLSEEGELRLSWTIVEALQGLSGLKHGRDPRPWREWAAGIGDDWSPSVADAERDYSGTSASFLGLPVLSAHVAFLVDLSGSMWDQGKDGRTRKEAADREVQRLLQSLPPDTQFTLIPYTDVPMPWRDELVSASPGNVKKAIADFEGEKARGKGDFWGAFQRAIQDEAIDSVMVLTDGAPTGGTRWNLDLIAALLAERNRYRNVVLDAVLFDAKRPIQARWEAMCAQTGGRCRAVDL